MPNLAYSYKLLFCNSLAADAAACQTPVSDIIVGIGRLSNIFVVYCVRKSTNILHRKYLKSSQIPLTCG